LARKGGIDYKHNWGSKIKEGITSIEKKKRKVMGGRKNEIAGAL